MPSGSPVVDIYALWYVLLKIYALWYALLRMYYLWYALLRKNDLCMPC
jgi:hypothetical protein